MLLQQGLRGLYSSERAKAIESVEEARRIFQELAPACKGEPLLAQEALMGEAKAEEALVGVPREGAPGETRGDLERATHLYQELAQTYPDSFLGQRAAAHLKELEANTKQVATFYGELQKLTDTKKK